MIAVENGLIATEWMVYWWAEEKCLVTYIISSKNLTFIMTSVLKKNTVYLDHDVKLFINEGPIVFTHQATCVTFFFGRTNPTDSSH